jgi:hypothetical protein
MVKRVAGEANCSGHENLLVPEHAFKFCRVRNAVSKRARRLAREYNIKMGMSEALVKVADELLDMGKQGLLLYQCCVARMISWLRSTSSDLSWDCCNDKDATLE